MDINNNIQLSLKDLEIGFMSGRFRQVLLPALQGSARKGEFIAVIGKNGVGKSTLLRTIAGLQPPLGGNLTVFGKSIADYSRMELSAKVGYISTEVIKVSNMRVYDLVSLGRFPHTNWYGRIDKADHNLIMESLTMTGMIRFRDRPVSELSDGERQRSMIAMVLAQDAGIMVLDEPIAFLDIGGKFEITQLMHDLTRTREKTIIFSTHDLAMAVRQADKIWLMNEKGFIEGAPEDLILDGSFTALFDETSVKFNPLDGSFSFCDQKKGKIIVSGEGEKRYWTEKALERAEYSVTDIHSSIVVEVPSASFPAWKCNASGYSRAFGSIYDLISWIRENNFIT